MRLKITLEYFTSPGEELILVLSGGKSIAMEYVAGGRWEASLEMPSKAAELEYSFELHRDGLCVRREWGHHSVPEHVVRQGLTNHRKGPALRHAQRPAPLKSVTAGRTVPRIPRSGPKPSPM